MATACSLTTATALLSRLPFLEFTPVHHPLHIENRTVYVSIPEPSNWGTQSDPEFKYHNGNSEPRGFGNIGVTVDDTYRACERFERLGVEFVKNPNNGKMKGIAFIKDPDGYWIEIFDLKTIGKITETAA